MAPRRALDARRLRIRRAFDPSRFQHRDLAFAFEQAVPIIRVALVTCKFDNDNASSDSRPTTRSAHSGAPS